MRQARKELAFLQLYVIGFLLGACFAILLGQGGGRLTPDELNRAMKHMDEGGKLLPYALLSRGGWSIFLILSGTTYLAKASCVFFLSWLGLSMGNFTTSCILQYGLEGFPLLCVLLFPHWLLYLPAFFFLVAWCLELYEKVCQNEELIRAEFVIRLIVITVMMAMGIVIESY